MGYFSETIDGAMLTAVNEAYFGKTKDVLKIEEAIHNFRKAMGVYNGSAVTNMKTWTGGFSMKYSGPEMAVKNAIGDAFGFSDVIFDWSNTFVPAIGTMPTSYCIDLGHRTLRNSLSRGGTSARKGFRYSKSDNIVFEVALCTGVFTDQTFTDGELTAILLHEIGHNFTPAVSDSCLYSCPILVYGAFILCQICEILFLRAYTGKNYVIGPKFISELLQTLITSSNLGKRVSEIINRFLHNIVLALPDELVEIIGVFGGIHNILNEFSTSLQDIAGKFRALSWPAYLIPNAAMSALGMIAKPRGYQDERFSDTFAQMYGYGPELISALNKLQSEYPMSVADMAMKKIPYLDTIFEFYTMPFAIVMQSLDEHPSNPARARIIIDNLEDELKSKNMSPATRKAIEKDIKDAKKMVNTYYDYYGKLDKSGGGYKVYQKAMFEVIGGDFKHNVLGTHTMDDIDAVLSSIDN